MVNLRDCSILSLKMVSGNVTFDLFPCCKNLSPLESIVSETHFLSGWQNCKSLKATCQAHKQIIYRIWQKNRDYADYAAILISEQFFPTENSEESPKDWSPHDPDWSRTSPGPSQHRKAALLYLDVLQSFIFYQRLGHLTLVTLYETVPHIVVKDPQWFAPFCFFVKKEKAESGYEIRSYCLQR